MAEVYKLSWLQSVSSVANSQDVNALVNGSATVVVSDLVMTVGDVDFAFPTSASVEWWVVTHNADKSKTAESVHNTFVATNQETLLAATDLSATWISHVA